MNKKDPMKVIRKFTAFYSRFTWIYKSRYLFSLEEIGIPLTGAESSVLIELERRGEIRAKELQEIVGMEQGYLSKIIKKFHKAGFLERKPFERDSRSYLITLTNQGRDLLERLNTHADEWYAERLSRLTKEEINLVTYHMESIMEIIENKNNTC
ncbi:MAG: MarR family transcriptional regulator [Thermovirgaceae bacterium]|nr:MarR family transcriptional regulator [Synergistales bacterium]MDD4023553.1 MarR family transcriptional regulator [Synergistales bacterium]HPI98947.1 MarR family transcriptional regulator [Synergistales bacterium]